ncbi:MAG: AsmA-like C-terminal region-containing protein [Candidatus Omnitrophota bacterium]|nr:AsmA-like C-terminal region-containing protein [Candidatus Omnitrophota bacterium]
MKKFFIIFLILVLLSSCAIAYLNNIFLPKKIKSLIIKSLQEQTQSLVSLGTVKFNIFKGIVLKDLIISDKENTVIGFKEVESGFFILPIFRKMIIIPCLKLSSPLVFLQRRKDNTFNIQELLKGLSISSQKGNFSVTVQRSEVNQGVIPAQAGIQKGYDRMDARFYGHDKNGRRELPEAELLHFSVFVRKVVMLDAEVDFQDDTFDKPFRKRIKGLNLILYLSLPANLRFNFWSNDPAIKIKAQGEYKIPQKELSCRVSLDSFSPQEISAYYQNSGITIPKGLVSSLIDIKLRDNILCARLSLENKNVSILRKGLSIMLNSNIKAGLEYNLRDKQVKFHGNAVVANSGISGAGFFYGIGKHKNTFLTTETSQRRVLSSPTSLANEVSCPINNISADAEFSNSGIFVKNLSADILGVPQKINGRIEFNQNQVSWTDLNLNFLGRSYKTSGTLKDFNTPLVQLTLASEGLSLKSIFLLNKKLITLSSLSAKYINSEFQITGEIDIREPHNLYSCLDGTLNIDLEDLREFVALLRMNSRENKEFLTAQLNKANLMGKVFVKLNLNGNINNLKSCAVFGQFLSPSFSAYGLKGGELSLNYEQKHGIVNIPFARLFFYGGQIDLTASMNLASGEFPYLLTAGMQRIKIEELKKDTQAKEKDITGILSGEIKVKGVSNDFSKLNGSGRLIVTDGKLWGINLLKGLGMLIFTHDFSRINFHEGHCDFYIRDKNILTDNLTLAGNIAKITGKARVGFDNSIDALLNVHILDELVPLSGTFKDVISAVVGHADKVGVITISGTLSDPKYKFKASIPDIIKGLKETIFGR